MNEESDIDTMELPEKKRKALRLLGGLCVAFAAWGLFGLVWAALPVLRVPQHSQLPHFPLAIACLGAVYAILMLMLLAVGIFFLRSDLRPWRIYITLMLAEVMVAIAAGMDWHAVSPAIRAADQVLTGAVLLMQFISLFPIAGPLLVLWVRRPD